MKSIFLMLSLMLPVTLLSSSASLAQSEDAATFSYDLMSLKVQAKALKSKLPEKVDDMTTMVDVKFEPTELTQWYVVDLSKLPVGKMFGQREVEQEAQQEMQQKVCSNPRSARLVNQGYRYTYHYADKEGASLADFTITTCP